MPAMFSQIEELLRDTLIMRAQGEAFEQLARLYGMRRPRVYTVDAWRRFMRAVMWSARGTPGVVHDALEGLYSGQAERFTVSLSSANPTRVTLEDGPVEAFTCGHLHRFVRLRFIPALALPFDTVRPVEDWPYVERVFFVAGPDIDDESDSAYLELVPVKTGYFEAANWASGPYQIDDEYSEATMDVLGFLYTEPTPGPISYDGFDPEPEAARLRGEPCRLNIYLEDTLVSVPPTYLLDPEGVDRDEVDPDMPLGGAIMDEFNLDDDDPAPPVGGDQEAGPYPIYLAGDELASIAEIFDVLLAAGVHAYVYARQWCAGD